MQALEINKIDSAQHFLCNGRPEDCLVILGYPHHLQSNDQAYAVSALALYLQKRLVEAETCYHKAISLNPTEPTHHLNLAKLLIDLDRQDEALMSYQQAISLDPTFEKALLGAANIYKKRENIDAALLLCSQACTFHRQSALSKSLQFELFFQKNQFCAAIEILTDFENGKFHGPPKIDFDDQLQQLATKEINSKDFLEFAEKVKDVAPKNIKLQLSIGNWFLRHKQPRKALGFLQCVREQAPDYQGVWNNICCALHDLGFIDEAIYTIEHHLKQEPSDTRAYSNRLMLKHYVPSDDRFENLKEHNSWNSSAALGCKDFPPFEEQIVEVRNKIRVGFVSPDFRQHPVGFFLQGLFEYFDRARFQLVCFSDVKDGDEYTTFFEQRCDLWHATKSLNNKELLKLIRESAIDVLIDCAGHTSNNRLPVFWARAAKLQLTGFGYFDTTGVKNMDYIIGDEHQTPKEWKHLFSETILQMPQNYITYTPPRDVSPVGPLPALEQGSKITFGSLNRIAKLSAPCIGTWASVLNSIPNSQLLLSTHALNDPWVQSRIRARFQALEVSPERILFEGPKPHSEFMDIYHRIDIALDTSPYSGGLTTCEALWMGVPVITLPNNHFAGRHSLAHLKTVGLDKWVATDVDDFVRIAVYWSNHRSELATLRKGLRAKMHRSPLCDHAAYTKHLQDFIEQKVHSRGKSS